MKSTVLMFAVPLIFSSFILPGKAKCEKPTQQPTQHSANLIRTQLAGIQMDVKQKDFIWFDAASGYYLAKTGSHWEHFGANLILTPDRKTIPFIKDPKTTVKVRQVKLPRLRSGSGINVGDTIAQVHHKLGEEPEYFYPEYKSPERTEVYFGCTKMKTPQKNGGFNLKTYYYRAEYTFRNGKLRTIEYNLTSPDTRV